MKIVVNKCFGGFGITKQAAEFMAARGNKQAIAELKEGEEENKWYGYGHAEGFNSGYNRTDPDLVAAVESLGKKANGSCAELRVIEIPDGIEYEIDEYDGVETIREQHRSW